MLCAALPSARTAPSRGNETVRGRELLRKARWALHRDAVRGGSGWLCSAAATAHVGIVAARRDCAVQRRAREHASVSESAVITRGHNKPTNKPVAFAQAELPPFIALLSRL